MGSAGKLTEPYRLAMEKDWEGMQLFYEENKIAFTSPLTVNNDYVFHIAVYSRSETLLKSLLEIDREIESYAQLDIGAESPRDGGKGRVRDWKNAWGDTALHEAAAVGDVEMAKILMSGEKGEVDITNEIGETPLFRAAAFGRIEMVKFLAAKVENRKIHLRRKDDTTILHIAVLAKSFDTALYLLEWDSSIGTTIDRNGMTCLQLLANMPSAFESGYPINALKRLLYLCLPDDDLETQVTSSQREDLECGCGRGRPCQFSYLNGRTDVSRMYYFVWRLIAQGFTAIRRLWDIKKQQNRVLKLTKELVKTDTTWMNSNVGEKPERISPGVEEKPERISSGVEEKPEGISPEEIDRVGKEENLQQQSATSDTPSLSETPLISAARNGIREIVECILDLYPQAIDHKNDKHDTILHVVAKHRRKEILDLLQDRPVLRSRLKRKINLRGDSILHQAAYSGTQQLRDRPGEALFMQSEIQWFKKVRKIVPPYFVNHRNGAGMTAEELFTKQHKQLVKDGGEWINQTTKACTIVAVLIATVAFTCAYTIPGGSNTRGHPLLLNKTPFRVFTVSDTLSLCFSLTSVVVFLSIMTSRMHEQDFRRSLPLKLVLGLTTLFFAVATMMVAFAATLLLMIRQRLHWAAIPIYTIACCPVAIFLLLQFPLYVNIAWSTVSDLVQSFIDSLPLRSTRMTRSSVHQHSG